MTGHKSIVSVARTTLGMNDHALFLALLRTGREVVNFDDRNYAWHEAPGSVDRLVRRVNRHAAGRALNRDIIRNLEACRPSLFIVFKHSLLTADVVETARSVGAHTVCVYPDLDPLVHGSAYVDAAQRFDDFCHTKPNLEDYFRAHVNSRARMIGPFYEKAHLREPGSVDPDVGVAFVGHHSSGKQELLRAFAKVYSGRVTIVGDRWDAEMFRGLRATVRVHPALYGLAAYRLYRNSVCCLGLLMEAVSSRTLGDEITSRSILVPAYGGVLLHARTKAAESVFGAGSVSLFGTMEEAARTAECLGADHSLRYDLWAQQRDCAIAAGTDVDAFVRECLAH